MTLLLLTLQTSCNTAHNFNDQGRPFAIYWVPAAEARVKFQSLSSSSKLSLWLSLPTVNSFLVQGIYAELRWWIGLWILSPRAESYYVFIVLPLIPPWRRKVSCRRLSLELSFHGISTDIYHFSSYYRTWCEFWKIIQRCKLVHRWSSPDFELIHVHGNSMDWITLTCRIWVYIQGFSLKLGFLKHWFPPIFALNRCETRDENKS